MKNIIVIVIILLTVILPASASEISGSISTNPDNPESVLKNIDINKNLSASGGNIVFSPKKDELSKPKAVVDVIAVLGFSAFADGSLLRGEDAKIYIVEGEYKKHIKNLKQLEKYSGETIFDVGEDMLANYESRQHSDGELIRELGDEKVFNISDGHLEHVLNLEDLQRNFSGQEIFNLSKKEMLQYEKR